MLIFEKSCKHRTALAQHPGLVDETHHIPERFLRTQSATLPEVSELQVVRHFTRLSQKNFSIDTHFYPLGSCTMKYNPRGVKVLASHPGFIQQHPLLPAEQNQGYLQCLFELQEYLKVITGMAGVSLAPMAGAQGEFAGVAMIKAYHDARGDLARDTILVPDAAHGTNPASAVMCGYKIKEIPTGEEGDIDFAAFQQALGPNIAGIMLTNPSTLGVFERRILEIAELTHQAGGLLYYDGANLNAILGKARPGDMGFDVLHLNLHKTFATPHGGGGPGAGPVAVSHRLLPYLPVPMVAENASQFTWLTEREFPQTIGRLSAFAGNAGILLRAYLYIRLLGASGLKQVGEIATLNANYLFKLLQNIGYQAAYPDRVATHEFILTLQAIAKQQGITATDLAKRLLDYGYHAPTVYFPLLVPECLLIEPTETECKQVLDDFVAVMATIFNEIKNTPDLLKQAPTHTPVQRLDDVKAARELNLRWLPET